MTFGSGTAFVAALRERVDREFNFIIPRLPQGFAPVIDICAIFDGRAQWLRFSVRAMDEQQLAFVASRIG